MLNSDYRLYFLLLTSVYISYVNAQSQRWQTMDFVLFRYVLDVTPSQHLAKNILCLFCQNLTMLQT